jgi:hypothetical protein
VGHDDEYAQKALIVHLVAWCNLHIGITSRSPLKKCDVLTRASHGSASVWSCKPASLTRFQTGLKLDAVIINIE